MHESPLEELIVRSTLECLFLQRLIVDAKKVATSAVKSGYRSFRCEPFGRQFAKLSQPNFVEHPAEVHNPSDFFPGAAKTRDPRFAKHRFTRTGRVFRETRRTSLICIIEVKKGRNDSIGYSRLLRVIAQATGTLIAPATLLHESIPDFDLFLGWFAASLTRPLEKRLVCSSLKHLCGERRILDLEKSAAAAVKAARVDIAQKRLVLEG